MRIPLVQNSIFEKYPHFHLMQLFAQNQWAKTFWCSRFKTYYNSAHNSFINTWVVWGFDFSQRFLFKSTTALWVKNNAAASFDRQSRGTNTCIKRKSYKNSTTTWTEFCYFLPHPPPLRGQFLYPEHGQKQTFFDPLPPSSCPCSYWMPPNYKMSLIAAT